MKIPLGLDVGRVNLTLAEAEDRGVFSEFKFGPLSGTHFYNNYEHFHFALRFCCRFMSRNEPSSVVAKREFGGFACPRFSVELYKGMCRPSVVEGKRQRHCDRLTVRWIV